MGWRSGSKLMIVVALGGCGVPSGSIVKLPREEVARTELATEAERTEAEPGAVAAVAAPAPSKAAPSQTAAVQATPRQAAVAEEAPAVASQIDFAQCRRFRAWPSWCNEAPKARVRVRRAADSEGQ